MAVYTHVDNETLARFLEAYDLGALRSYEGIAQGVSNTNYILNMESGRYILTLFEPRRVDTAHVPFFLSYATHLADAGIPAARAVVNRQGRLSGTLMGRPAAIMSFCDGAHPAVITPDLCHQAGTLAAQIHVAGAAFGQTLPNDYGPSRWHAWLAGMAEHLGDIAFGLHAAVEHELNAYDGTWPDDLPRGAIHGDLFPDNVFFNGGKVSGVIDFHFACTDMLAYDLAIMINAWCFDEAAVFQPARYEHLMAGYQAVRPLNNEEKAALPLLLRGAALRFVLSRCEEVLSYKEGDVMTPHNPLAFIKRLEFFQENSDGC